MTTGLRGEKDFTPAFPDIGAGPLAADPARARNAPAGPTLGQRAFHNLRLLVAAVWLGSAVFFSAAVAPSAFAVLPSRELAGALVARTLTIVNVGGCVVGLFLLAGALVGRGGVKIPARLLELLSLLTLAAATGAGHWWIAARMAALRVQMARPIEEVAADDPLRVAFNALHGQSVTALSIAMIAGAVALLLIARRTK